jgi:glutamate-1-semialdehyde 2,1-aminomutase
MPGGVSSPVRAFRAVGGEPIFLAKGSGSKIWDVDGAEYIDYVCSWGALLLGHGNRRVVEAVAEQVRVGTSFGAPTEPELLLAERIRRLFPSMELVRFVNSGTEATMSAVRLARAFTGRKKIVKFDGCYHGHADTFLSSAGSGLATFGIPSSPGVPPETASSVISLPYNDVRRVEDAFSREGDSVAAVIVEPVAGNMGVVPPAPGFLRALRKVCDERGSLLVFDEVITGFRVSPGGAQELYGVRPDLTCLGKVIGGGFPVGAYGGREEVMRMISPDGPVYQAGTLAGNPVAMVAGLCTVSQLTAGTYTKLERLGSKLERGLLEQAAGSGVDLVVNRVGSMLGLFFGSGPVMNFEDVQATESRLYPGFFWSMIRGGVYMAPSPFESTFLSAAHSSEDIERTVQAAGVAFRSVKLRGRHA